MPDQLNLIAASAPAVRPEEVEKLIELLHSAGDWLTAGEIAGLYFDGGRTASSDRRIRAIANAARGRIISYPGGPGYKLLTQATAEEVNRAIDTTEHQAREMQSRAMAWRKAYHRRAA